MARGYNKAILMGNLAKDPEARQTQNGKITTSFSVAVNREWKDKSGEKQSSCDFIPVVTWGPLAENCERYLAKGRPVLVEGRIQVRSYEDKSGQKRWVTEIVANDVTFLPSKKDGDGEARGSGGSGGYRDDRMGGQMDDRGFPMDISEMDGPGEYDEADIPF